jgi:hypothetical protein
MHGIPSKFPAEPSSRDLWQWLAVLGGIGLIAEWLLFGRRRILNARANARARVTFAAKWRKAS